MLPEIGIALLAIVVPLSVLSGFVVLRGLTLTRRKQTLGVAAASVALATLLWLPLTSLNALLGGYEAESVMGQLPGILFAVSIPCFIFVVLGFTKTGEAMAQALPLHWLIGMQWYRIVGIAFLLMLWTDFLPAVFARPAGWGDILTGIFAPVVALAVYRQVYRYETLAWLWNFFGFGDLLLALTIGLLCASTPIQVLYPSPSTSLVGVFPMPLIPTYIVPISLFLHIITFRKLMWLRRSSQQLD